MKSIDFSPARDAATPEERLVAVGIVLPAAQRPIGAFTNVREVGGLLYVSGQGPILEDGRTMRGKVGADIDAEAARGHAELAAINILAALRSHCGSLDKVRGIVKLLGLVNATPDFERHPFVVDGASNLLARVFGEAGVHARSAFGVASLPNSITVEIEAICERV
ncbi:RidA family protein [Mangrovibrevibacter kandeliae]|uniref:RidA family protein n=1 Tax=Mangrovibrevibacter kandeliae TaxID=2968473 RepID=UPI002119A87E|nr:MULTISPECIES: RidA family protein [unclassified Aurantimonas]MCQ8781615.1 RidA family protein [Aurantimonas sp. CSK15Z-1]MCW4114939.1 RidA family protein [Aurantimonas sp. MSK8Z-1]